MSEQYLVSDAEREAAVVRLREASTDGRLTLEELHDRTGLAYGARTHGELVRVTADLPATHAVAPGKSLGLSIGFFIPAVRRGRWRVARRTVVLSLFAPCLLDLRKASFSHAKASIFVLSLFGPVKLDVSEDVDVDVSVLSIFAPTIERGAPETVPAGAPRLRVIGLTLFAPIFVKHSGS
jgi:hypothetical protein